MIKILSLFPTEFNSEIEFIDWEFDEVEEEDGADEGDVAIEVTDHDQEKTV